MLMNSCVYDFDGNAIGCITPNFVNRCQTAFSLFAEKFSGAEMDPVIGMMKKSLIVSMSDKTADFMNCLRVVSTRYRSYLPPEFIEEVKTMYSDLLRECCSSSVTDEIRNAIIERFQTEGAIFYGAATMGAKIDECAFAYKDVVFFIKMEDQNDLLAFASCNPENCQRCFARISGCDDKCGEVTGSNLEDLVKNVFDVINAIVEIKAAKEMPPVPNVNVTVCQPVNDETAQIADKLLEIVKQLVGENETIA